MAVIEPGDDSMAVGEITLAAKIDGEVIVVSNLLTYDFVSELRPTFSPVTFRGGPRPPISTPAQYTEHNH